MKRIEFCDGVRKYTLTAYEDGVHITTESVYSRSHSEVFLPKAHLKEVIRFLTEAAEDTELRTHYENTEKDSAKSSEVFPEIITMHDTLHGMGFETFDDLELAKTFADCLRKSLSEREVEIYTQVDDDRGGKGVRKRIAVGEQDWSLRCGLAMTEPALTTPP